MTVKVVSIALAQHVCFTTRYGFSMGLSCTNAGYEQVTVLHLL